MKPAHLRQAEKVNPLNVKKITEQTAIFTIRIKKDPIYFAQEVLGLPMHPDQMKWVRNATKKINILRPGNRWGKSFIEAILHVWHCITKPMITGKVDTQRDWFTMPYETLNFGPGYEQAREVLRLARDIVEGNILFPKKLWSDWGKTNKSKLAGWAISNDRVDSQNIPSLHFVTGAKILCRSYADMGAAFKAKALAFISGDECADISELWTFTNVTLLPRLVSYGGILHFVGTVQSEGHDYMKMIEMAEDDMKTENYEKEGMFYVQKGRMYDNKFLDEEEIKRTEKIADETLRKQIIEGQYVETGNKYFGYRRINNAIDNKIILIDKAIPNHKYIVSADFAASKASWADFTVVMVIDYTKEPYKLVHFWRIKGGDLSIPGQYAKVEEIVKAFRGRLIIDATALGGINAMQFLRHLNPVPLKVNPQVKADMLSTLKVAFDGGQSKTMKREKEINALGEVFDKNPNWGLIRYPLIAPLLSELQNYKLDDKKIKTDCVMTLAQAIYWIELRRPKQDRRQAIDFDFLRII